MQPLSQAIAFKKTYFQGQHIGFILMSIPTPNFMRHRKSHRHTFQRFLSKPFFLAEEPFEFLMVATHHMSFPRFFMRTLIPKPLWGLIFLTFRHIKLVLVTKAGFEPARGFIKPLSEPKSDVFNHSTTWQCFFVFPVRLELTRFAATELKSVGSTNFPKEVNIFVPLTRLQLVLPKKQHPQCCGSSSSPTEVYLQL